MDVDAASTGTRGTAAVHRPPGDRGPDGLHGASVDEGPLSASVEVLRARARFWVVGLSAVFAVGLTFTGHPRLLLVWGTVGVLAALYSRHLSEAARSVLLSGLIVLVVMTMYEGRSAGHESAGALYATVVFTLILHSRSVLVGATSVAAILLLLVAIWNLDPNAAQGPGRMPIGLALPTLSMVAFSVSWRRSVLLEHAGSRLGQRLAAQNRMLRQTYEELDELGAIAERTRIARELHDRVGHCLASIHVFLQAADRQIGSDDHPAAVAVARAREATALAFREVRECVEYLQPPSDPVPIGERMRRMIDGYVSSDKVELIVEDTELLLSTRAQEVLLRCTQEALTNAVRHAAAEKVTVRLWHEQQRIVLTVRDDGKGCGVVCAGFGLQGMKDRISDMRGKFMVDTSPGAGFEIRVELPREERSWQFV